MNGGGGNDFFNIRAGDDLATDLFNGGSGIDILVNLSNADLVFSTLDTTLNAIGIEQLNMDGFAVLGTSGANVFNLNNLDFFNASLVAGTAHISTGAGDDTVTGTNRDASNTSSFSQILTYDLGTGNDSFTGNNSVRAVILGGDGR